MKPKLVALAAAMTLVSAGAFADCVGYTGPGGPCSTGQGAVYQPDPVGDCLPVLEAASPPAHAADFPPPRGRPIHGAGWRALHGTWRWHVNWPRGPQSS